MKTYKVGVIRVLTTEDETVLNCHGKLLERYYPMFQVTSRCIPEQFEGVHDEETERQSIPKVVALAEEMYREGFDAVIVSCAGDPGVEEARKLLPIPVVGAGESVATPFAVLRRKACSSWYFGCRSQGLSAAVWG